MAHPAANLEDSTQSAASSGNIEDIALIEEHVDSGLIDLLNSYRPVKKLADIPFDSYDQRYQLRLDEPLPQYDSASGKAYAAMDGAQKERATIAILCDPKIPMRRNAIESMRGLNHPHLMSLREAGNVKLSTNGELRHALFMDRPKGERISAQFNVMRDMHERHVIDKILVPLIDALAAMAEKGVSHGRINTDNVYFSGHATLGECLSEPQGMSQNFFYEPVERLLCEPLAKGAATPKSDAYALGMLAFDVMFGLEKYRNVKLKELARALLEKGPYHCYVVHKDYSDVMADFFRGTLTDNKQERWGIDQLRSWAGGKRFNLILPSIPKEASRPYEFSDREYFACRPLANAIFENWASASKQIRATKLDRWLEMSAHQSDRAELVGRTIKNYGGEHGGTDSVNNEMLSKLIVALDPVGPIRYRSIALNPDGMGLAISEYFKERENVKIRTLLDIIELDLPNYWSEMTEGDKTALTSNMLWAIQRMRSYISWRSFGFGMERVIYDLNPGLPCQSSILLPYAVTSIDDTLMVLDNLAKEHAKDTSFADRHLAAFLASKVEMSKEVKFNQLNKVPKLKDHPELLALRVISIAQDKGGRQKMVGLATWAALRVDKLLDNIHSRKLRRKIRENLRVAAKSGMVSRVLAVVVENDLTKDDHLGFTRANTVYMRNQVRMDALKNGSTLQNMAKDFGGRIAVFIAYAILCITCYQVLDTYYF